MQAHRNVSLGLTLYIYSKSFIEAPFLGRTHFFDVSDPKEPRNISDGQAHKDLFGVLQL